MIEYDKEYSLKDICEELSIKYDKNHAIRSLNKISSDYEIEKVSRYKYKINRELTTEEKINNIVYGKYKELLRPIIITTLSKYPNNKIQKRMKEYLQIFGMVNSNYAPYTWSNRNTALVEYICDLDVGESIMDTFIKEVDPMLKRIVKDIWKEMEEEDLIEVVPHPFIAILDTIILDNGNEVVTIKTHQATTDEREQLLEAKKESAIEMGLKNSSEIPFSRYTEFKSKVNKKMGIKYFFDEYELILNRKWLGKSEYCLDDISLHKFLINQQTILKTEKSKQGGLKNIPEYDKYVCIDTVIDSKTQKIHLKDNNK